MKKQKKITCFISSLASGGAEHQLAILANLLCEKGYEVEFVTCLNDKDFYELDHRIHRINIETHDSNFISGIKMIHYFRTVKTDVIISFRERMNLVAILGTLGRNIKIIAGERNFTIDKPTTVGFLNQNFLYYLADYIVANSKSQATYLCSLRKKWNKKVSTIINYTNLHSFRVAELPKDSIIKIGVFARYSPQKNCLKFIEMAHSVWSNTDKKFEIHWFGQRVGKFNEIYYKQVVGAIKDHNASDYFILHDAVNNVSDRMSEFHAIALPSFYEGFSNSIAEGICCGKPMLVSDVSDNSTMVQDGVNGFLFDPNDVHSMAMAFNSFLNLSTDQIHNMAKRSRAIAETLFDSERYVNSYIELIEK